MKIKFAKLLVPCILSLGCLTGCGSDDPNDPKNVDKYYADYDLTLEGAELRIELQRLCFETHTVYVKYSAYGSHASFTRDHISCDAAPSTVTDSLEDCMKNGKNEYFYTGKIAKGYGTREHVWPCANSSELWAHGKGKGGQHDVDATGYYGGGSDLYHVRPSTSSVNTARGNSKFVDFSDPEFKGYTNIMSYGDGGKYKIKLYGYELSGSTPQYADKAEVADEYKGDVARILVYLWVHYGSCGDQDYIPSQHAHTVGNLDLCNVLGYGSDKSRVYDKLCEWNKIDPPSETEKLRNKTVQKMQGNRNPFVDHPELMESLLLEM